MNLDHGGVVPVNKILGGEMPQHGDFNHAITGEKQVVRCA